MFLYLENILELQTIKTQVYADFRGWNKAEDVSK